MSSTEQKFLHFLYSLGKFDSKSNIKSQQSAQCIKSWRKEVGGYQQQILTLKKWSPPRSDHPVNYIQNPFPACIFISIISTYFSFHCNFLVISFSRNLKIYFSQWQLKPPDSLCDHSSSDMGIMGSSNCCWTASPKQQRARLGVVGQQHPVCSIFSALVWEEATAWQ